MQLFKTRGSSKLRAFLLDVEEEEDVEKVPPGYLSAEELSVKKEYYQKIVDDAEASGRDSTLHGSCRLVRRQAEIYGEWELKAVKTGLVLADEFHYAYSNDAVLARIHGEEVLQSHEEEKERWRKFGVQYGFKRQLYSFEAYDLPWLLELKTLGWLPKYVEFYNLLTTRNDRIPIEEHISFLSRVYNSGTEESHHEWKEHCRKYGRDQLNLLDFEMNDLPWLLEIDEKDLGFPYSVEFNVSDGTIQTVSPKEWIRILQDSPESIRVESLTGESSSSDA